MDVSYDVDSNAVNTRCDGGNSSSSSSSSRNGDCCHGSRGSSDGGGCHSDTTTLHQSNDETTTNNIHNDVTKHSTKITHIRPILTPYELEVGLDMIEWQEVYPMEYYSQDGGPWSNGNILHRPSR